MTITEAYHKGYNDGLFDGYNSSSIEQGFTKEEYDPPEEQELSVKPVGMIPLSVIEDIRADIETEYKCCKLPYPILANGIKLALDIIDKHISGKEQE